MVLTPTPPTGAGSGAARGTLHRSPVELCRLSFVLEGKKKKGRAEAVKVARFFLCSFFFSPSPHQAEIYIYERRSGVYLCGPSSGPAPRPLHRPLGVAAAGLLFCVFAGAMWEKLLL